MTEALLTLMTWGAPNLDLAALVLRLGVGVPFFISGMNKLLCPVCHAGLKNNLIRSGIPCVPFTVWWLAFWEAAAGLLLALGLLTTAAAFVLFIVCAVAFKVSWRRKLAAKNPAHFFDACTEVGFMFDVLLTWMVVAIAFIGPGLYSLDAHFFAKLMP